MKTAPEVPPKELSEKSYTSPRLLNYGNLVTMTAAASMNFNLMDGGPNNLKS
jgi:hypothetical protein